MAEVARGHVSDRPFARTIYTIALKRFTGQLDLTEAGETYRLGWRQGLVVAATSASPMDSSSRIALAAGLVNSTQLGDAMRRASAEPNRSQLELLGEVAGLTPDHLQRIEALACEAAAARAFALEKASFVLDDRLELPPTRRIDPRWLVFHGVKKHYREARLATEATTLRGRPFRLTEQGRKNIPAFGFDASEMQVAKALERGPVTVESLVQTLGLERRAVLAIAYALAVTDSVVPATTAQPRQPPPPQRQPPPPQPRQQARPPKPTRPNPARAAEIETSRKASVAGISVRNAKPESQAERSRAARDVLRLIETKLAAMDAGADHFVLLGLEGDATSDQVRTGYFGLAKQLHPDRLRAIGLADSNREAHRLFARVNEAFAVLSDSVRRRKYVEMLRQGGETAVKAKQRAAEETALQILAAEKEFRRGTLALSHGHFVAARGAFEKAVELNPDEAEHHALYGWALWCTSEDKEAVLKTVTGRFSRALGLQPKCVPALFYRGQVAKQQGNLETARECFQKVLHHRPDHKDAQLELRLLAKRGSSKKGILDRLKRR